MRAVVTVDEAIAKGKKTIIYPALAMFLGSIIGSIILVAQLELTPWYIGGGFALGFILMYFYWNTAITKWRIWAFENVRNVHELKRKAIESKLISEDGTRSERNEIRSHEQRQKLKQLEKKFQQNDVYRDDFNVAKETIIKHSLPNNLLMLAFGLFLVGVTSYTFVTGEKSYYMLVPFAIGGFVVYTTSKDLTAKEPQIILNSNGIKLYKKSLMEWKYVAHENIEARNEGKYIRYYLVLDYKKERVEMNVGSLDMKHNKIENLLRVYRVRYEKNNPA